ncbi:BrnA antitoxin family protein [Paraburkholderia sp. JHI2823]|uniref:BrnA antitoxin family protein n=1 Tax=Paraburkholderia TaxID=1822464 RepID=UPI000416F174|nr:BrnA antitoxin family protein [Paraburkholderia mimosarum]
MKKPPRLIRNTPDEEAAIARGIAADADTFEPTDEQFAQMKRRGGRPKLANPKVAVTVRYDADIVERFKAGGDGWQTRMNNALREWLATHHA